MALTTLRPDSTISSTEAEDESGGTTNLHDALNEGTPSDSTYTHTQHNAADANCHLGLDNLPADADNTQPISTTNAIAYTIRVRNFQGAAQSNDTITLHAQIFSSADVAYTNQVLVRDYNDNSGTSAFADETGTFTTQTAGLNASEADWNSAKIVFTWTYTKASKADPVDIDISNVELDVTYDQAAAAPVISSPTASTTGTSTGTGGFSTDTTSGTGYYYISTSATPPSAADLKAGASPADDSGSSTVTASPHTFNFSGLTQGTTYYAHYIQNNGVDSNIVTSASFTTYDIVTADTTFSKDLSESLVNLLTGLKEITLTNDLSETINNILTGYRDISFNTDLSMTQVATIIIEGNLTLGVNFAKSSSIALSKAAAFTADLTVSKSSVVSRLLAETVSYSLSLDVDPNTLGVGILDDPVYSAGNYIFVDLTNIALTAGTVKSGTLTLTNQLGKTTTINLVGEAATNILLDLAEVQNAKADRSASATLSKQLSEASTAALDIFKSIAFSIDMSKLSSSEVATLASLVFSLQANEDYINLLEGSKDITFNQNLTETLSAAADRTADLVLSSSISKDSIASLTKHLTIDFDTTLSIINDIQADLKAAISYLTDLSDLLTNESTGVKSAFITMGYTLAKTEQIQHVLTPVLSFIMSISDTMVAQKVTSEAISYLLQVQETVNSNKISLGILDLIVDVSAEEVVESGIFAYVDFIVDVAKNVNIQVDYFETFALLLNISQSSANLKSTNALTTFNNTLSIEQVNQLHKLLSIALVNNLQVTPTNQADLNSTIAIAGQLSTFLISETLGSIESFITFSSTVEQNSLSIKQTSESTNFQTLLEQLNSGSRDLLVSTELEITLDDLSSVNLGRQGIANFNTTFLKLADNNIIGRPSLTIDMTVADLSSADKETLTEILLGMQAEVGYFGAREISALTLYGLNNGLDTSINLTAEGQVTFSTALIETGITQLLGQAGITFGQVVGLASLGSALRDADISLGSIVGASNDGFVIQFTIVTPGGRRFKVYLEDRITIVNEENRVIAVYEND
jgi:hypothetical protein